MAGPRTRVDYTSDTGDVYRTSIPSWVATLLGASTGTATASMPKGLKPRRRYARITATGREKSFVVPDIGAAHWTDGFGTAVIVPLFGAAVPGSANATLEGRTGEKTRDI
jgi:hypothetical protein